IADAVEMRICGDHAITGLEALYRIERPSEGAADGGTANGTVSTAGRYLRYRAPPFANRLPVVPQHSMPFKKSTAPSMHARLSTSPKKVLSDRGFFENDPPMLHLSSAPCLPSKHADIRRCADQATGGSPERFLFAFLSFWALLPSNAECQKNM